MGQALCLSFALYLGHCFESTHHNFQSFLFLLFQYTFVNENIETSYSIMEFFTWKTKVLRVYGRCSLGNLRFFSYVAYFSISLKDILFLRTAIAHLYQQCQLCFKYIHILVFFIHSDKSRKKWAYISAFLILCSIQQQHIFIMLMIEQLEK